MTQVASSHEACLPLHDLMHLGWVFPRGAAFTPLGALELGAPRAAKFEASREQMFDADHNLASYTLWAFTPARPLVRFREHGLLLGTVGFLASNGLEDLVSALLMLLERSGTIDTATNEVIDAVMYITPQAKAYSGPYPTSTPAPNPPPQH